MVFPVIPVATLLLSFFPIGEGERPPLPTEFFCLGISIENSRKQQQAFEIVGLSCGVVLFGARLGRGFRK